MKEQLAKYLIRYSNFNKLEIETIYKKCSVKTYKKKDFLLKQNNICKYKFFILKGLVRQFRVEDNGNENISVFAIENWWISNLDSFINQTLSINSIQAIEETTVLQITKEELEYLYAEIPKLEQAFRKIYANMIIAIQRKSDIYMKKNSRERYYDMIEQIPDFSQRVPQYMIASYLDITPEYLSEVRKKHSS
ncbi:Crp/Fnr family transcriptional regulator [Eudoraea chungangensis]|uniref:Crp/Fnr family transcriptional regulator n=1 Tax=Eudoraea chungangensis TaxID=1481905 RepID=UPI0023EDB0D0|nr:Crp/Fnr family transcriptional regulator [Eudoraea chungangensis]